MKRAALLLCLFAACAGEEESPAPVFALSDIVAPALAAAEAAVSTAAAAPTPSADTRELVLGALGTLASHDARLRDAAAQDVIAQGDAAVPVLAAAIADAEVPAEERAAAVDVLARIDTRSAVDALTLALEKGGEPWIRARAAWRVADVKRDEAMLRWLLRLRYETDSETVIWLAAALAKHGNYAGLDGLRVLRASAATEELRANAVQRLDELVQLAGASDADALYAEWQSGALDARLPAKAPSKELELEVWRAISGLAAWDLRGVDDRRFALSRMNAWVVPLLARTLHDQNVYLRVHAAQCLERRGERGKAAGPELVQALGDARAAPAAAATLGALRWVDAAPALESALTTSRDLDLRTAAARALGALAQARSAAALAKAFAADEPTDLRQAAAEALLALRDDDAAVRFLHGCMTSTSADPGSAESALGAWLGRRAQGGDAKLADVQTRWIALDPTPNEIATTAQALERQRARAKLLDEVLAASAR